ncbi:MAG: transcriptional regulator [Bacteroidetes bacterium]|nr:transcriptional regulator [Bacteroidota bacterium]
MSTEFHCITVISERLLKDDLIQLMKKEGAKGFSITDSVGEGSRGIHASDWEGRNVKIESIVHGETAKRIMEQVAEHYFEDYAVIAYSYPVSVVREEKFK